MKKFFAFALASVSLAAAAREISLAGDWRVSLSNNSSSQSLQHSNTQTLEHSNTARLPGTLAAAKIGKRWTERDFQTTMDLPQSEALVQEWQYVGKATWSREIVLSADDCRRPLELFLERVMWKSEAFWDGASLGSRDSLATPHVHPIPRNLLTPGKHEIKIEIDNSCFYNFSRQGHSYGPNMQAVWNGALGKIELRESNPLRASRVFASADGALKIEVPSSFAATKESVALDELGIESLSESPSPHRAGFKFVEIKLRGKPIAWNEFHPQLYVVTLRDAQNDFAHRIRFGFRTVGVRGLALTLNGNEIFTRGNVDNANFARDGIPWTDVESWRKIFRAMKEEDGINAVRFHTWCPPEAAFRAADEFGILMQPESGIWTDGWMSEGDEVGNGKPVDEFVKREMKAIADAYGNSPSFFSLSIGNELGNSNFETMGKWVAAHKLYDPRALAYASSARTITPADDFSLSHRVPAKGRARERLFPKTDWDYEDVYSAATLPTVAHEIGQWPVYPIWDELLSPFTGAMRPWNLTRHRDTAAKKDALRFQRECHFASARLNRIIYKEEVESFLRTPSCAGLQLLNVQDYTGQAEALVGWRDPFYEIKSGFKNLPPFANAWKPIAKLARFQKFTWTVGEKFSAELQIRNLTDKTLARGTKFAYELGGKRSEVALAADVAPGKIASLGKVETEIVGAMTKEKQTLRFGENEWNFWAYPNEAKCELPRRIVATADAKEMKRALAEGKTVLYRGPSFKSAQGKFKPVYWSARWFPVANTTAAALGTWFDVKHPALGGFVTEAFTDWQWHSLAEGATIHRLRGMPNGWRPIALSVNDFHFSDFTATMFEAIVGRGRLFVCGYDLDKETPEAKRLRACVCRYLAGEPTKDVAHMPAKWLDDEFDAPAPIDLSGAVYDCKTNWIGRTFKTTLRGIPPTTGNLQIDFRQPNGGLTSGRGLAEGKVFEVPFTERKDEGASVSIPLIREDFLDGKIEIEANVMTGSALGIERIRVIPEK